MPPSKAGATITDTCTAMPDDARRFPLIPENHGELLLTNCGGYATNGNCYTTTLDWLAGGHASGRWHQNLMDCHQDFECTL